MVAWFTPQNDQDVVNVPVASGVRDSVAFSGVITHQSSAGRRKNRAPRRRGKPNVMFTFFR